MSSRMCCYVVWVKFTKALAEYAFSILNVDKMADAVCFAFFFLVLV